MRTVETMRGIQKLIEVRVTEAPVWKFGRSEVRRVRVRARARVGMRARAWLTWK
jgi:hypothetical protein